MNKKIDLKLVGFTAIAAIIGAGLATGVGASAYGDMFNRKGAGPDEKSREAIHDALENDDYATWSSLVQEQCTQNITEEHFEEMQEHYKENEEQRVAIDEAIENGDYDAWVELMSKDGRGNMITTKVTEDNFATFAEMHQAIQDGDFEKAEELRQELGLEMPPHGAPGFEKGMRKGKGNGGGRNQ